jgi:hypothetical protein
MSELGEIYGEIESETLVSRVTSAMFQAYVPAIQFCDQLTSRGKGIEKPDNVCEQRFPRAQFTFMHEVDNKHAERVEAERS